MDGVKIHYLTAGRGPAVILVHGYTQTSRMWRPLIPQLAQRFTVVAPDLPGIGDSEIPKDGIDIKTSAIRIHALAVQLHLQETRVVGHDIGLMVAYAYAAMYPAETKKLVVMDAFLPGIDGWESYYNNPNLWHFRFHGPTPEALVAGRERIYFAYFWNDMAADKNHSVPPTDRQAYVATYSKPGRMRAGWAYFASWPQTANDLAALGKTKLTIPVLVHRRRQGQRGNTDAPDAFGSHQRTNVDSEGHGALGPRGTPEGDDGRPCKLPLAQFWQASARPDVR